MPGVLLAANYLNQLASLFAMAKKYHVVYERQQCIGAAQCVALMPELWVLDKDGKATLKGSKKKDGTWELDLDEKQLEKMKLAATSCPVNVIHIIDAAGKKLI